MAAEMDVVSHAAVTIETVASDKPRHGDETHTDEGFGQVSSEQFMRITVSLPAINQPIKTEKTHVILVVDKSGSMAGSAWKQVQESLKVIVGQTVRRTDIHTHLIIYADNAKIVDFNKNDYEQVIDGLKAGGMTNFKSAFVKLCTVMGEADKAFKNTVIVFMTDGNDTANDKALIPRLVPKLAEKLVEMETQSVIHAVGFTSSHDFTFLKSLAERGGKSPGMFRYCESGDSRKALQDKLDELFDFILQGNDDSTTLDIQFADDVNVILSHGKPGPHATLKTQRVEQEPEDTKDVILVSETWVQLKNFSQPVTVSLTVHTNMIVNGQPKSVAIPCIIDKIEYNMLESDYDKTHWRLRILLRNVDDLVTRASIAITEKKDTAPIQAKIEKYQTLITHIQVFGSGITKQGREKIFTTIKEIQTTLDTIQSMLAEYVRAGTDSVSLLARAHDLRYKAVFSKSRRQRTMDKRASKNMAYATTAQEVLSSLVIQEEDVDQLSQDALQFYFCVLSQNSIRDVLLGDDKEDAIGFGLAVKRSEVVLDEPSLIKLYVISGTLVSRTAMLDALEYKINVSSHLKAHGGFSFKDQSLGVTTVGASREPINAWLPLYVTKCHWDRVKVILKPALGSFCTLDPLGYHYKQLDVMFMVLGSMIGQLNEENVGEHQLRLIFAVQRTCAACISEFDLATQVKDIVEQFVLSAGGRTRDVIAHLYTLIGYIVAMPTDTAREIFKMEDENNSIGQFWVAFISEWLRRAAGSLYRDTKKPILTGMVNTLLHGSGSSDDRAVTNTTRELIKLCLDDSVTELDVDVTPFDPLDNLEEPTVKLEHDQKIDRAMETWAEKASGHQKNLGKTKKYKDALKIVRGWNQGSAEIMGDYLESANQNPGSSNGAESGDVSQEDSEEENEENIEPQTGSTSRIPVTSQFDCQIVAQSALNLTAQLQHRVCRAAYPGLETLPGCMAFVNNWLSRSHYAEELDSNSGLAPDSWIEEVKAAVRGTCEEIQDYTNQQLEGKEVLQVTNEATTTQKGEGSNAEIVDDTQGNTESETVINHTDTDVIEQKDDQPKRNHGNPPHGDDSRNGGNNSGKGTKQICLPSVLHFVNPSLDVVQMTRAVLCQVISYHSNSIARSAITNKEFIDLSGGNQTAVALLQKCDTALEEYKHTARKNVFEKAMWKRANHCMIRASTPWAFTGYLMNTYTTRAEGFTDLIDLFLATINTGDVPPYFKEKIHILFTGKYKENSVLDKGNQMLPVGKLAEKVTDIIGLPAWEELNQELRSTVQIHVYRESDIPNRHGHCNSNPYIPNRLREKLGMKLIDENKRNPLKRRNRKT